MKKCFRLFVFLFAIFINLNSYGNNSSANLANNRTALRCFELANKFLNEKKYNQAISQVNLGFAYDDSISDLWYLYAIASKNLDSPKGNILSYVKTSLEKNNWVEYNKDNARLLYADLLCDTSSYNEVFDLLDASPMIYSSDAEIIRVKAFYRQNTSESIQKAREKIDVARRIFPSDHRFPLAFFTYENPETNDDLFIKLRDYFLSQSKNYENNEKLYILASSFAEGENKIRMLKSFNARGMKNPLYSKLALESGLLSEEEALTYLSSFSNKYIDYDFFQSFLINLKDTNVREKVKEYISSYEGLIYKDLDGDKINNIFVKYYRGRPQTVYYDNNQDDILEWSLICDYGVPISLDFPSKKTEFNWNTYPNAKSIIFDKGLKNEEKYERTFYFIDNEFSWSPILMSDKNPLSSNYDLEFFFPEIAEENLTLSNLLLMEKVNLVSIPSLKNKNERLDFTLIDKEVVNIKYYSNDKLYAKCIFENNYPSVKTLDSDKDNKFETTEIYSLKDEGQLILDDFQEELKYLNDLYENTFDFSKVYLSKVQIDFDMDTHSDYIEEYGENNLKISSWDNNEDGNWDIMFVSQNDENGNLLEKSMFYSNTDNKLVTIEYKNKIPLNINYDNQNYLVKPGKSQNFYWVYFNNEDFESSDLSNLETLIMTSFSEGQKSFTFEDKEIIYICYKYMDYYYSYPTKKIVLEDSSEESQTNEE